MQLMKRFAPLCALALSLAACAGRPPGLPPGDPADPASPQSPRPAASTLLQPQVDWPGHAAPGTAAPAARAAHEHPAAPADAAVTYTCPMHPEVRQQGPGRCPICKMNLVPAKDEGGSTHAH